MGKLIQKYFEEKNIKIEIMLEKDLREVNDVNTILKYALQNLLKVNGINDLLKEIAKETDTIKYHNKIVELHAVCVVHKILQYEIVEVETRSKKIFSPKRTGNYSCDIKAINPNNRKEYYFESKDSSYEKTTEYLFENRTHYTPIIHEQIRKWIRKQCNVANKKGADFLILKVPIWEGKDFTINNWLKEIFDNDIKVIKNEVYINIPSCSFSTISAIYILYTNELFDFQKIKILKN